MTLVDQTLSLFALVGTGVFAISGALMALRKRMDLVGITFIAALTGVGGGTVRDLLLGDTPVAWVRDPTSVLICMVCAVAVSLLHRTVIDRPLTWLLYADAAGLALFAVLGAAKAESLGAHPAVAVLFGAMTATFGGLIRDVICGERPILFRKEIYITAALAGGGTFILVPAAWGFDARAGIGLGVGLSLRLAAIWFRWVLPFPRYDTDPPR
ncbi:MAG: trimeric intracellular cation channel family protein [Alphaproteobacteria bacterium]